MEKKTHRLEENSNKAVLSTDESTLPDDLLKNSNEFLKLHEEHQPELQQTTRQLEKSTEDFLHKFKKALRIDRTSAILLLINGLLQILMVYMYGSSIRILEFAFHIIALVVAVVALRRMRAEQRKITGEIETSQKTFNLVVGPAVMILNNISNSVEKILQHQNEREPKGLGKSAAAVAELAEIFKPEELQGLLEQAKRASDGVQDLDLHYTAVRRMLEMGIIFGLKNYWIYKDFSKLEKQETVRENEVGSKVGRFIWKTKQMIHHQRNVCYEITSLKTEVEMVIIPKLNQYFKQWRACKEKLVRSPNFISASL